MVAPVTGPFTVDKTTGSSPVYNGGSHSFQRKVGSKQKKPYNLQLDHSSSHKSVGFSSTVSGLYFTLNSPSINNDAGLWGTMFYKHSPEAYNKAHADFVKKLTLSKAQLGAALGERKKSLDMITHRSSQLFRAFRAIKRLRFGELQKILGLKEARKRPLRSSADALLEYRFGWAPLVEDVSNSMKIMTQGLPSILVVGRAYSEGIIKNVADSNNGNTVVTGYDSIESYRASWKLRARVRGIDPNLMRANQLGLVNPAAVAWELVPFSFVVDYFVNVGDWLNGFTDLYGYELTDQTRSLRQIGASKDTRTWYSVYDPSTRHTWTGTGRRAELQRTVGPFPGPTLRFHNDVALPFWRAATSVALLVQMLRRF